MSASFANAMPGASDLFVDALPPRSDAGQGPKPPRLREQAIQAALGKSYADLKSLAARDVLALEQDKTQLHRRIEQLETEAADTAEVIARLNEDLGSKDRELSECKKSFDLAQATIRDLETAASVETRVLREFSKMIAELGLPIEPTRQAAAGAGPKS
ncbi:MAG: hypothetical protein R3D80_13165 [Paracoccaceae bacterium]